MTSEGKGLTEKWIEKHGAHYPYAYDKGGALQRWFGVRGIPHAILVDPLGRVVWRGHPAGLTEADIRPHLAAAAKTPLYAWPEEARKAAKYLGKRDFAKALEEARGLEDPQWAALVQAQIDLRLAAVKALHGEGDWLGVETQGELFADELEGTPAGAELESMLKALEDDDAAQAVLKAQEKVVKLTSGKIKPKQVPKLIEELRELAAEHPGTIVARDVDRAIARLPQER